MIRLGRIGLFTALAVAVLAVAALTVAAAIIVFVLGRAPADESASFTVEAVYPGATASEVEKTVADPIEQQVNGVEHLRRLRSRCGRDGSYLLEVTLKTGIDLNMAQVLIQNRVALALPALPAEIRQLGVTVRKRSPGLLMIICLRSPHGRFGSRELGVYPSTELKDELARLPGVAEVAIVGEQFGAGRPGFASHDGKRVAALAVYPLPRVDPRDVSAAVEDKLAELRQRSPEGVDTFTALDLSRNATARAQGCLLLDVNPPDGASMEATAAVLGRCEQFLTQLPDVQNVLALSEQPFDRNRDQPCMVVCLKPLPGASVDHERLMREIREGLSAADRMAFIRIRDLTGRASSQRLGYPIDFAIYGPDRHRVQELATKLVERMSQDRRLADVWAAPRPVPALTVKIDRAKAAALGLAAADITASLESFLGPAQSGTKNSSLWTWPVREQAGSRRQTDIDALNQLLIRNDKGRMVPLREVAAFRRVNEPIDLERRDLVPAMSITASPARPLSLAESRFVCERLAAEVLPKQQPAEYRLAWLREMPAARAPAEP
jgi:multidrug efflux pump subunit AcrB